MDIIRYVYDGNNILTETDDAGVTDAVYTLQPQAYGNLVSLHRDAESHFFHFDGIHNTSELTDDAETVTDDYRHSAWGKTLSSSGTTANSHTYKGRLGYYRDPNLDADEESYIAHHRIVAGNRFTSEDPAEDDLNLYRNVRNNPVNRADPSGLGPLDFLFNAGKSRNKLIEELAKPGEQSVQKNSPQDRAITAAQAAHERNQRKARVAGEAIFATVDAVAETAKPATNLVNGLLYLSGEALANDLIVPEFQGQFNGVRSANYRRGGGTGIQDVESVPVGYSWPVC